MTYEKGADLICSFAVLALTGFIMNQLLKRSIFVNLYITLHIDSILIFQRP